MIIFEQTHRIMLVFRDKISTCSARTGFTLPLYGEIKFFPMSWDSLTLRTCLDLFTFFCFFFVR